MDAFKKMTFKSVGHGGVGCPCCSDYRPNVNGKKSTAPKLRRITRRRMAQSDTKRFEQYLQDDLTEELYR